MGIRSDREIYQILEKYLREAPYPMTCVDLMDIGEVEAEALSEFGNDKRQATNKLSDTLGFMWRRGLLKRYPAAATEGGVMARYAYVWNHVDTPEPKPMTAPIKPKMGFSIQEHEEGVIIDFDKFTIYIKAK